MKKWNNPELLNLKLQETEASDPRWIIPIVRICTGCGKWFVPESEEANHRWVWTSYLPPRGYYACNPSQEIEPPSDDPTIGNS